MLGTERRRSLRDGDSVNIAPYMRTKWGCDHQVSPRIRLDEEDVSQDGRLLFNVEGSDVHHSIKISHDAIAYPLVMQRRVQCWVGMRGFRQRLMTATRLSHLRYRGLSYPAGPSAHFLVLLSSSHHRICRFPSRVAPVNLGFPPPRRTCS